MHLTHDVPDKIDLTGDAKIRDDLKFTSFYIKLEQVYRFVNIVTQANATYANTRSSINTSTNRAIGQKGDGAAVRGNGRLNHVDPV